MAVTLPPLIHPPSRVDRGVQRVLGAVQERVFDGFIGQTLAKASRIDWVAAQADKLHLSAFKPAPKAPVLERPVVMVPGLLMAAASYDPMARHFAENKANGPVVTYVVSDGKFHEGGASGPVMGEAALKKAKLFQLQYPEVRGAPTDKAPLLGQAFEAIARVTGAPKLDVVAHSAGCSDLRLYVDSRSSAEQARVGFQNTVLIGPAIQGSYMGNVGDKLGGLFGVDKAGEQLEVGSALVARLNESWEHQKSQLGEVAVIAVSGAPTAGPGGLSDGDGFMRVKDLQLPNARTVVLRGLDPTPLAHLTETSYSGVIAEVQAQLGR